MVARGVGESGFEKTLVAFRALVATAAVELLDGMDAGHGFTEGHVGAQFQDFHFREVPVGAEESKTGGEGEIDSAFDGFEVFISGIGEGVSGKNSEGDGGDLLKVTPDRGLAEEEEIAAGEKDGGVGGVFVGGLASGGAPVVAIDFADGALEDFEGGDDGGIQRGEIAAQAGFLGLLPDESETDVDGLDAWGGAGEVADEDGAVDSAADQHGDGVVAPVRRVLCHPIANRGRVTKQSSPRSIATERGDSRLSTSRGDP